MGIFGKMGRSIKTSIRRAEIEKREDYRTILDCASVLTEPIDDGRYLTPKMAFEVGLNRGLTEEQAHLAADVLGLYDWDYALEYGNFLNDSFDYSRDQMEKILLDSGFSEEHVDRLLCKFYSVHD